MKLLKRRRAVVPFVDTLDPGEEITRDSSAEFERWRAGGFKVPPDLDSDKAAYFDRIKTAATTTTMFTMGNFAADPDPWVRLALTVNPSVYEVIMWGDGEENFGLHEDRNSWVRAVAWFVDPTPPPHIRAALSM